MSTTLVVLLASILLGACSGSEDPKGEITSSQAQAIWSSTQLALGVVEQKMVPDLQRADKLKGKDDSPTGDGGLGKDSDGGLGKDSDGALGKDSDGALGKDSDGALGKDNDGGSGWFSGTISSFTINGTVTNPKGGGTAMVTGTGGKKTGGWGVSLTITFKQWEVDDEIVINGPLALDYLLTAFSPLSMTMTVKGTVMATISKIPVPLPAQVDVQVKVSGTTTTVCGTVAGSTVGGGACS